MTRFFLIFISLIVLTLSTADAAIYKGQREFVKKCLKCHKEGQNFVASKKTKVWKKYFKNKGKPLAQLHLKSKKAKKSWKYFKSRRFAKKSRHLKQFLVEYAKDSGNVPACN